MKKSLSLKIGMLFVIVVPFLGFIGAILLAFQTSYIRWIDLAMVFLFGLPIGFGVTVGYHRLFTHISFRTTKFIESVLAIFGAMAWEGGVLTWCAQHRVHHLESDRPRDLHSPYKYVLEHDDDTLWGMLKGFIHAHVGWLVTSDDHDFKFVPDLMKKSHIKTISSHWYIFAIIGLIIPTVIGGLWSHSWYGAKLGLLWALARVFLVNHVTFAINSICHMFGTKDYITPTNDESRNNRFMAIVGLGEGNHNCHHAFQRSARHGLDGQPDLSYRLIQTLEKLGWAWDVKIPSPEQQEALRILPDK